MPEEKVQQQPPDVVAMVLADNVLRDPGGKCYIQGTYAAIFAPEFPYRHPSIIAYIAITSGHGRTPLTVRLIDADEARPPVFEANAVIDFPDPLAMSEVVFAHYGVVFPEPGEYRLQLYGGGAPLRERRIQVGPPPGAEPG
jgi:hypothetical protein